MFRVYRLDSFDAPELTPYKTMRQQRDHHDQRIFIAEGEKVVRRLLQSDFPVVSALMPEKWLPLLAPLLEARPEDIPVYLAEREVLERLTGFSMYQGVLAVGKIPLTPTLNSVLALSVRPYLFVAMDALNNSENMGVLVRNCAAFGVQALLVGETCTSPFLRRSVRASMGTIFKLPVVEPKCLADALRELRVQGVRCVAAHPHGDKRTLYEADFTGNCCIVFGSEGLGITRRVLEACDEPVAIPMHAGVDSLNVGSAAAVFLAEANRQRWRAG
jgi:tRNA G18 (ribose-2'-O)-methylase SpoU